MTTDPEPVASDDEVVAAVGRFTDGASRSELQTVLADRIGERTLRSRLATLVRTGRLLKLGDRRWTRYALPEPVADDRAQVEDALSAAGRRSLQRLEAPTDSRPAARYRRDYARAYVPNATRWLDDAERARLHELCTVTGTEQPAGTYARNILDRLLIDLSFNSSRLEANTYSLLDTRRLIELDVEAEGHDPREAQMIRNHRDAIEFLVENADETGFDRRTVLNLHAALASELLPDPLDAGRLRTVPVSIGHSTYVPEAVPQVIEEAFAELLARLDAIDDPFEQALVTLAQLPYLQPFVDVNKRVSRLAANMPLIRANLVPVSFVDVPRTLYAKALLAVYEHEDHALLKDLFLWACERSARRYTEVRDSLDAPDPFRVRYRQKLVGFVTEQGARRDAAAPRRVRRPSLGRGARSRTRSHAVRRARRKRAAGAARGQLRSLSPSAFRVRRVAGAAGRGSAALSTVGTTRREHAVVADPARLHRPKSILPFLRLWTPMQLHLLRHGRTHWNAERRVQGQLDSALDATGRAQAQALASYLGALDLDAVYCSTSGRTRETATLVLRDSTVPVRYRDELREICLGVWEGRLWSEIERDEPEEIAHFRSGDTDFAVDGAESRARVQRRGVGAIERIIGEAAGERVLVVSRGAVLRAVLCHYADRPLMGSGTVPALGNCSLTLLEADGAKRRVVFASEPD